MVIKGIVLLCVGVFIYGFGVMGLFRRWLIWLILVSNGWLVLVFVLLLSVGVFMVFSVLVFIVLYMCYVLVFMLLVIIRIVYGLCDVMICWVVFMLLKWGMIRFISIMLGGCVV